MGKGQTAENRALDFAKDNWKDKPQEVIDTLTSTFKGRGKVDKSLAMCFYYFGLSEFVLHSFELALSNLESSKDVLEKSKAEDGVLNADIDYYIARCYHNLSDTEKAVKYYNRAVKSAEKYGNKNAKIMSLYYIVNLSMEDVDFEMIAKKSKEILAAVGREQEKYYQVVSDTYFFLGMSLTRIGEYKDAIGYLVESEKRYMGDTTEHKIILNVIYGELVTCYQGVGDYESAKAVARKLDKIIADLQEIEKNAENKPN